MNAPFFHEQAASCSQRLMGPSNDHDRIDLAFRLLYQRGPTSSEVVQAESFISQYPGSVEEKWSGYARVLLAANEFMFLD
jgi:hypothetical protein